MINYNLKFQKEVKKMLKFISKADGKIAITVLGIAALLLLAIFMIPIVKVDAAHCTSGAINPCTEDVRNTKHNLSINDDILASGTTEVCIFCHTPHGANATTTGGISNGAAPQAPLWNRKVNLGTAYTPYSGPNFDSMGTNPGRPKGVSLACLSCHDGTISFDSLINPPGSGGFIPGNLTDGSPGTRMTGITFTGFGADTDGDGTMDQAARPQQLTGGFTGGDADYATSVTADGLTPYPNLTLDLKDDHPISMQMPSTDPQFADVLLNRLANLNPTGETGKVDGEHVSYVSRYGKGEATGAGTADTRWSQDKRDRIRLYPSVSTESSSIYVECASCHNPHTPRTLFLRLPTVSRTNFAGDNFAGGGAGTTLVVGATRDLSHSPNEGSLVCLSCHQK